MCLLRDRQLLFFLGGGRRGEVGLVFFHKKIPAKTTENNRATLRKAMGRKRNQASAFYSLGPVFQFKTNSCLNYSSGTKSNHLQR